MGAAPRPLTGRCLCGGVTYRVDADPIAQGACHCADCQRQSGSPFSVIVAVPEAAFSVEGSTLASFATIGEDHGQETRRHFCAACGSPLFSLSPLVPGVVLLKAGSLDDASWIEPAMEWWTGSAQPWSPRFEQAVVFERGPS